MNEKLIDICDMIYEDKEVLRKKMIWETGSNSLSILAAFMYASENKRADAEKYKECKKILKKTVGAFNELRGLVEAVVITKMSLTDNPQEYAEGVRDVYKKLRSIHKLTASPYMVLASMTIYEKGGVAKADEYIDILEEIYKKMKAAHPMLTWDSDRALMAVMATSDVNVDKIIDKVEENYKTFKGMTIYKDALHSMAQALAVSDKPSEVLKEEITDLSKELKKAKKKVDKQFGLTTLGLLTMLDIPKDQIVSEMVEADEYLKTKRGFKWYNNNGPRFRRIYDALVVMLLHANGQNEMIKAAMSTTMDFIIAVIVSTMIAVSSSSAAASSSSSGS